MPEQPERIAKYLARLGIGSRRQVERWLADQRIRIDGALPPGPGIRISADNRITLDGKPLPRRKPATRLWRYHKPPGLLTSHGDTHDRPTVFASLPPDMPRVISIGRLDLPSEGLLLLTNDGELARRLELPAHGWERCYRVFTRGAPDAAGLDALNRGMRIDGVNHRCRARMEKRERNGARLHITLTEGKNRQIRRMLEHLGLETVRLIRLSHGPFRLGRLRPQEVREISSPLTHLNENAHAHQRR